MSRRDTIIVAVLINACLLVVLFATAITKKEEPQVASSYKETPIIPAPQVLDFEEIERSLVKESRSLNQSYPLAPSTSPSAETLTPIAFSEEISLQPPQAPTPPQVTPMTQTARASAPASRSDISSTTKDKKYIEITVKNGDYLDKIGRENNTSVSEIMSYNSLKNTQLRVGQVLRIPVKGQADTAAKKNAALKQYIVKPGDTPWKIANEHHMQVDELLKLNHLDKESSKRLKPGDKLYIR